MHESQTKILSKLDPLRLAMEQLPEGLSVTLIQLTGSGEARIQIYMGDRGSNRNLLEGTQWEPRDGYYTHAIGTTGVLLSCNDWDFDDLTQTAPRVRPIITLPMQSLEPAKG